MPLHSKLSSPYSQSFRLVSLPPHIGDLQQLKELHVRHNKLKCLPASIQKLHLYTFTGTCCVHHTANIGGPNPGTQFTTLLNVVRILCLASGRH